MVIFSLSAGNHNLLAQRQTDSTSIPLLASLEKNTEARYVVIKSNLVFPEILKGNEEEMLPYIEKYSSQKKEYIKKMYTKGKNYLPRVATVLKRYNLPEELKSLLALESEYNGNAVSKAGAVGYWQIMDEMARDYGMKYIVRGSNGGKTKKIKPASKDDRKDFVKATNTVARYLRDRKRNLDDNLLLVVASYNCGLGNVKKAIRKGCIANPTFWDIQKYLPAETKKYVMNFITLSVIFHNYEMFAANKLNFASQKILV
ncbi:MAG: lytic transglycosylase domain-containing protein, partial [Ferruginibacter sp.]